MCDGRLSFPRFILYCRTENSTRAGTRLRRSGGREVGGRRRSSSDGGLFRSGKGMDALRSAAGKRRRSSASLPSASASVLIVSASASTRSPSLLSAILFLRHRRRFGAGMRCGGTSGRRKKLFCAFSLFPHEEAGDSGRCDDDGRGYTGDEGGAAAAVLRRSRAFCGRGSAALRFAHADAQLDRRGG